MNTRPITTLFMLMSADGKISTGAADTLDMDADLPHIPGMAEGLQQYYDVEQTTDLWSLCSGRVQAKVGANEKPLPGKTPVSWNFTTMPSEERQNGVGSALTAYAADPTDGNWEAVKTAFVDGWATEYQLANG